MTSERHERPRRNHGWRPLIGVIVVMAVLAGSALVLAFRHSSRGGDCAETSARRQLDLSSPGSPTPAQLDSAAEILRKRIRLYDCDASVRVDGWRLEVSAGAAAVVHLDELLAPGELQLREVLDAQPATHCGLPDNVVPAETQFIACSEDGLEQYTLAPAKVVGADITTATARKDSQLGAWQVSISFTGQGQRKFTDLTAELISKRMAIVLDTVVISAPTIQAQVDGDAQITGSFTESSAKALVNELKYGALPVRLHRG